MKFFNSKILSSLCGIALLWLLPVFGVNAVAEETAAIPDVESDSVALQDESGDSSITAIDHQELKTVLDEKFSFFDVKPQNISEKIFAGEITAPEEVRFYQRQAIKVYQLGFKHFPRSFQAPAAQFRIAEVYFNRGELDQALAEYQKVIDNYSLWWNYRPSKYCDDAQYKICLIYLKREQYDKAFEAFDTLLNNYPDTDLAAEVYAGIAICLEEKGEIDAATATHKKLRQLARDKKIVAKATLNAGKLYHLKGDYEQAIEYYNRAIEQLPMSSVADEAQFRIGKVYVSQEKYQEARIQFRCVIDSYDLNPHTQEALYELAYAYYLEGKYGQAVDSFSRLLARQPAHTQKFNALMLLGDSYEKQGLNKMALKVYEGIYKEQQYLVSAQELLKVHYLIAVCSQKTGQVKQAVRIFRQVADSRIDAALSEKSAFAVGKILYQQKKFEEAIAADRWAMKNFPNSKLRYEAQLAEIRYYRDAGEVLKVLRMIDPLIKSFDQDQQLNLWAEAVGIKASIYYRVGGFEQALPLYEKLYQADLPENEKPRIIFRLARCSESEGEFERASTLYSDLPQSFPDSVWAQQAEVNLKSLKLARHIK